MALLGLASMYNEHWRVMSVTAGFVAKIRNNLKDYTQLSITFGGGSNDTILKRPTSDDLI